jgi:hypothetical protein
MNSNLNSDGNPKTEYGSHPLLVDRALMGLDLTAEHHLANCQCCQGEREKTEQALRQYAEFEREQGARQESFWRDQATRIRAACGSAKRRPAVAAVLVPALGLLLAIGLGFALRRHPAPAPATARVETISDQDLLLAVESAVDSGTPYALEPVALTVDVQDLNRVVPQKSVTHSKLRKETASHVE